MKAKTIVVFASAAVLPLGAAWATQPTGPQGTGWYGYNAPSFATLDRNGDGVISADEYATANLRAERRAPAYGSPSAGATIPPGYDRNGDGVISRDEMPAGDVRSSGPYSGPSWETNPPVPAP
ncbi:MAG: hypothetical protein A3G81_10265 [Betaproteobacteria bacterium RIFCSPLOWO2_12_FULL_65_14]|nr:MAG: hypothetical protein A3G81_10265 [Betaproteobacteria bacterium RIFCSPLOWO2_12_FULL_65_14]